MKRYAIVLHLMVAGSFSFTPPATEAQPILTGFVEATQGWRVERNDALGDGDLGERSYPRSELRVQMSVAGYGDRGRYFIRGDFISDGTHANRSMVDLREAYLKFTLFEWLDVKAGRQVATWGTGDLIFANDLFAKDWEAFFTGLDDTYLKPPQDLLRVTAYADGVTLELALSPYFTPDNLPSGTRLSVYNPFMMTAVDAAHAPLVLRPKKIPTNGEAFGRIFGTVDSFEWALYGYKGFWPTPQGVTPGTALYYPRLWSVGGSLRGPIGSYLMHGELAAYISQHDTDGDNPRVANSQVRGLVGVDKSLGGELTVGLQYYGELMLDHELYLMGAPSEAVWEELRSTVTARINKFLENQAVQLALFAYWGITDEDWHLRPEIGYKITDAIKWTLGGIVVGGNQPFTTFGQFQDNSNIFTRLRYSF